jgi:hypothetical protein
VKVPAGRDAGRGVTAAVHGDDGPRMSRRVTTVLPWLLCGASLTLGVFGLVLESLNGHPIIDSMVVGIVPLAMIGPGT